MNTSQKILASHLGWDEYSDGPVMANTTEIIAAMEEYANQSAGVWSNHGRPKEDGSYLCEYNQSGIDEGVPNRHMIVDFKKDDMGDILWWDGCVMKWLDTPLYYPSPSRGFTEEEIIGFKKLREYFGEHDKTTHEHYLYAVVNKLLASPQQSGGKEYVFADAITRRTLLQGKVEGEQWAITNCKNCGSGNLAKEDIYRCKDCRCFHDKNGMQL